MSVSKRFEKAEPGQGKLAPTQSDCPRRGMCRQPNYSRAEKPRRPHLEITGFWTKSVLIFKSLCENANQSIRQLARQTGMSKSSVHRLTQAIARRDRSPESW